MQEKNVHMMLQTFSRQTPDEQTEPIRLLTRGSLSQQPDGWKLVYQENDADDDTGELKSSTVTLLIFPDRMEMIRDGEYGTAMVFQKDKRFEGVYRTPYGELDMALFCTDLTSELTLGSGTVEVRYQLDLQGSFAAMIDLKINYRAVHDHDA